MPRRVEIILGPTGVGKTAYAINRALEVGSPVINADSRQIYKELCIGTAAPSRREREMVKHYFVRWIPVTQNYTAGIYEADALALVNHVLLRNIRTFDLDELRHTPVPHVTRTHGKEPGRLVGMADNAVVAVTRTRIALKAQDPIRPVHDDVPRARIVLRAIPRRQLARCRPTHKIPRLDRRHIAEHQSVRLCLNEREEEMKRPVLVPYCRIAIGRAGISL